MEDALGDSPATAFIVTALAFAIPFLRAASAATSTSVSAAAPTSLGATTVVSETLPLVVEATATLEIGEGCLNTGISGPHILTHTARRLARGVFKLANRFGSGAPPAQDRRESAETGGVIDARTDAALHGAYNGS